MSQTSGPYPPVLNQIIEAQNPLQGSGNVQSVAVVIKNVSPYLLEVATGGGSLTALVDPFTSDIVVLDPTAGQQLAITPTSIGIVPPPGVMGAIYATWYQAGEIPAGTYPFAIPLAGNTTSGGLEIATALSPLTSDEILPAPQSGYCYRFQQVVFWAETSSPGVQTLLQAGPTTTYNLYASPPSTSAGGVNLTDTHNFEGLLVASAIFVESTGTVSAGRLDLFYDTVVIS